MNRLSREYNELTDKEKNNFKSVMIEALEFIPLIGPAVNFFNSVADWNKYKTDKIIPKIMEIAKPKNIDEDSQENIAYALKNVIKEVSEDGNITISQLVSVMKGEFADKIYEKYKNNLLVEEDNSKITYIKAYIKEIIVVILNNITMFETAETIAQTNLIINVKQEDSIKELNKKVTAHEKAIKKLKEQPSHDDENSDNAVLKNSENQEGCSAEEERKTDDAPKLKYIIPGLILLILLFLLFKYCSHQSSNKSNKPITSTTTSSKVSTTTEPIITTETVTAIQKETETRSTVIQTSTTISNHTTNEVALTENTSPEQTELPPIETTTVVTEPPSNSNAESKFKFEEYHINAIEDFCEDVSGVIITGYEGTPPEHLIIPAKIDDKQVIAIKNEVFSECNIKSLVIPDTVYEIQERAFSECSYLSNIYLGKNVLIIGKEAFFCSQFDSNEERILTVSNPKFEDKEEAAFRGERWNGRNNDDYTIETVQSGAVQ